MYGTKFTDTLMLRPDTLYTFYILLPSMSALLVHIF